MNRDEMIAFLRAAAKVAREAIAHGHHPFGAVVVGSDGHIFMRQDNINTVRHAEAELAVFCFRSESAKNVTEQSAASLRNQDVLLHQRLSVGHLFSWS